MQDVHTCTACRVIVNSCVEFHCLSAYINLGYCTKSVEVVPTYTCIQYYQMQFRISPNPKHFLTYFYAQTHKLISKLQQAIHVERLTKST